MKSCLQEAPQSEQIFKLQKLLQVAQNHQLASDILDIELPGCPDLLLPHLKNAWLVIENIFKDSYKLDLGAKSNFINNLFDKGISQFRGIISESENINFNDSEKVNINFIKRIKVNKSLLSKLIYELKLSLSKLTGWKPWYRLKITYYLATLLLIASLSYLAYQKYKSYLLGFSIVDSTQEWGALGINKSVEGNILSIAKTRCLSGLGTHANSQIIIKARSPFTRLEGSCGVDDEPNASYGNVQCEIIQNDKSLFKSDILKAGMAAQAFNVQIDSQYPLKLVINDAGNGRNGDHGDWCNLKAN